MLKESQSFPDIGRNLMTFTTISTPKRLLRDMVIVRQTVPPKPCLEE